MLIYTAALHWGFEFAEYHGSKGYPRLFLGAVPVVYAWSTLAFDPLLALVAQWVGYTALWWVDMKATSAGWSECLQLRHSSNCSAHPKGSISANVVFAIQILPYLARRLVVSIHHIAGSPTEIKYCCPYIASSAP